MLTYHQFSIMEGDHFVPSAFPQVDASIRYVVAQLSEEPGIKMEMLLSFVKDHCIRSVQVTEHPELADRISTKSLPFQPIEALFEAARNNRVFRQELEDYIRSCF
jgi:hypothetical protein